MPAGTGARIPRQDTDKRRTGAPDDFGLPPGREQYYGDEAARRAEDDQTDAASRRAATGQPPKASVDRARAQASRARTSAKPRPRTKGPRGPRGAPAPSRRRGSSRPLISPNQPTLRRPLGQTVAIGAGTGVAGVFLGAIVYAVLLSVVDYGTAGPGMWFKAKFMNQVGGGTPVQVSPGLGPTVSPNNPWGAPSQPNPIPSNNG